ncbi:MAG: transglycosylase family protein [Tetrasphaera sp.]
MARATLPVRFPALGTRAPRRAGRARLTLAGASVAAAASLLVPATAHAETVWDRVADCESSGNWQINTGNGFYGGLQFAHSTWLGFGGAQYASYAHLASKGAQIAVAQEVLKVQGPGAWPVCSVRAGLTVENGLAVDPWAEDGGDSGGGDTGGGDTGGEPQSGDVVVDGVLGPQTYGAMETWLGQSVDGSLSTSDKQALQRKLGVGADGVIGPVTTAALQRHVGASADGVWGSATTTALQNYLNRVL